MGARDTRIWRSLRRRLGAEPGVPAHLARRFRTLRPADRERLRDVLVERRFRHAAPGHLESEEGRRDLRDHLEWRLHQDRTRVVPWLDSVCPLESAKVLEIGSGTGCATVALAEQGARVTGLDPEKDALAVAEERCRLHGVGAELVAGDAAELPGCLGPRARRFDLVVFTASLEHMTGDERRRALAGAWELLRPGDLLAVVETPNRLWHTDLHTARLPYFHWLPDDLAFDYARRSPRAGFRELYRQRDDASLRHFLRRGRGVSFHELELALGLRARDLDVVSCLRLWRRSPAWIEATRRWRRRRSLEARWVRLLAEITPEVPAAFLQPYLDLVIRKPGEPA